MKSFCIKSNTAGIINYLLDEFSALNLEKLYISSNSFKIYDNIILHYNGNDINLFYNYFCNILSKAIIKFYEPLKIKQELNKNFFYFNHFEKEQILEIFDNELENQTNSLVLNRFTAIYKSLLNYINEGHHSVIFNGFCNFRLSSYNAILDCLLSNCVNRFLLEREYLEFINLLKLYISSNSPKESTIHLIYLKTNSILLDDNKQIIDIKHSDLLNAKFLSDITFSDNDYILNYLLNALPAQLVIHIPNLSYFQDEFLNTLRLIFENRVCICTDCVI